MGTLYSGFLAEILSRKFAIPINVAIFLIGVVVPPLEELLSSCGGRFIAGMRIGSLSMIVPMYNPECGPPDVRCLLVGLQQDFCSLPELSLETGPLMSD